MSIFYILSEHKDHVTCKTDYAYYSSLYRERLLTTTYIQLMLSVSID